VPGEGEIKLMASIKHNQRYARSIELMRKAEQVIPTGAQTFSKSKLQFPVGKAPHFLVRGKGGRVWDVDGNEYVDLMAGLLPVLLGYRDPDVDDAIRHQLDNGISFSLATDLEVEVSEKLVDLIPCAEMVRFGKNGSDVTTAAIRLARAVTGRDEIIMCGYHGWHDWSIGTTVWNKGVPDVVSSLTHRARFNDPEHLKSVFESLKNKIAALILEPVSIEYPVEGYLESIKEICEQNGALLVFDEIITGFRAARGGAQELLSVTPDLACFGKAMGNGMPISAIVGRSKYMKHFEDVFFSGTFAGETLSLAAANAVIDKIINEPVVDRLWKQGQYLSEQIETLINKYSLDGILKLSGIPPWQILKIVDHENATVAEIKTFIITSLLESGVLTTGSHNMMYAHNEEDLKIVINAYSSTLLGLSKELEQKGLAERLGVELIKPVFAVR